MSRRKLTSEKSNGRAPLGAIKYSQPIDLVRFTAFFLVFFTHFINQGGNAIVLGGGQWWDNFLIQKIANFGGQGVTIFFCLTGFLLGRLLIQEYESTKQISVTSFYMRRLLRIWPLYFLFLIICFGLNFFANSPTITKDELPFLASFTYNWGQIFGNLPGTMATITWSISVEEQIYLFFPFVLILMKWKKFASASYFLIILGMASRAYVLLFTELSVYRHTMCYLDVVGIGLLMAVHEKRVLRFWENNSKYLSLLVSFLLIYVFYFSQISTTDLGIFLGFILTSLCMPALLIIYTKLSLKFSENSFILRCLTYIGRRSYGCYLFHWMIWQIMVGKNIGSTFESGFTIPGVLLAFLLTIICSAFSYKIFEQPFLAMRMRYKKVVSP